LFVVSVDPFICVCTYYISDGMQFRLSHCLGPLVNHFLLSRYYQFSNYTPKEKKCKRSTYIYGLWHIMRVAWVATKANDWVLEKGDAIRNLLENVKERQ